MFKKENSITNLTLRTISTDTTLLTQIDNSNSTNSNNSNSSTNEFKTSTLDRKQLDESTITATTTATSNTVGFSLNSSFDDSNTSSINCLSQNNNNNNNRLIINNRKDETNIHPEEKEGLLLFELKKFEPSTAQLVSLSNTVESNNINNNDNCNSNKTECLKKLSVYGGETNLKFKNKLLDYFADIRCFTFFMCLIVMLTNALGVGYRNSVVTTIEKRYEYSSVFSGVLSGCLEVGSLITTLFVSYFCARSHIPRCISASALCCAIGSFLYAFPHLLSGSYTINSKVMNKTNHEMMCKNLVQTNLNSSSITAQAQHGESPVVTFLSSSLDINPNCLLKPSNIGHFTILIIANVLIGSSSAPLYTLGTSYIDNHVTKDNSSIYLGFMYSMLAFGPVVGYLVGAGMLQIYVDHFRYSIKDLNLNPDDSQWIGAWFLGFIIFGVLIFITAFPFLLFPREITKNRKEVENEENNTIENSHSTNGPDSYFANNKNEISESSFGNFRTLPKAIKNILFNKVFLIVTLGYCFEINIISGFMTFLPKYIEHQFSVGNSMANIYTGLCAIPGACVGIVAGGFLVKKFKINPRGASVMAIACCILCLIGIIFLIFLGCPNIKMAGTTTSYVSFNKDKLLNAKKVEVDEFNLSSKCNKDCHCSTSYIEPICGKNGITYFSPCFAGCKKSKIDDSPGLSKDERKKHFYHSCSCIMEDLLNNSTYTHDDIYRKPNAESGLCSFNCSALMPFLIMLFIITLLTALNQMPMLMVTLRSVKEIERPFALGLQLVIMRLLAYIPSPLIFGKAIDLTCLVWRRDECNHVGSCLFYDREKFRHVYGSIAAFYKIISLLLFVLLYFTVRKYNFNQHQTQHESVSVNRKETQAK